MGIQLASEELVRPGRFELAEPSQAHVEIRTNLALPELQIIRTIGSLVVFLAHFAAIYYPSSIPVAPSRAHADYVSRGVVCFFILSGLVLALPFVGDKPENFSVKQFYLKRFFRLYPAYWASILFALGLRFIVTHWVGLSNFSPWPQTFWSGPITPRILLEHVAGFYYSARPINPAYWTFALEMQACLLFPLMIPVVRRTRWTSGLVIIAALTVLSHYQPFIFVIRTVSYFLMGAYVAKYNRQLKIAFQNAPRSLVWGFLLLYAGLLWLAPYAEVPYRISFLIFDGSLALLTVAVQVFRPLATLARLRPTQKFAEWSYCFYLVHLPILAGLGFILYPYVHSPVLTGAAAFTLSLMVAWLAYTFVEVPLRRWKPSANADLPRRTGLLSKETVAS